MTLSLAVMADLMDRYVALFGPLGGKRDTTLMEWQRQLGDMPLDALHRALDTLGRQHEGNFKPRLAVIRSLAYGASGEQLRHEEGAGTEWCSQCRGHYFYAGYSCPDGSVKPRIRCMCPQLAAGWHTDEAQGWREDDAQLLASGYTRPPQAGAA